MEKTMRRRAEERTLMEDERAVSPVIGVILMIAITVVIAAVVASFAYGIIGSVKTAPSASIVIENAQRSASTINVTLIHQGGDIVTDAFNGNETATSDKWKNIEVRYNGAIVDNTVYLNNIGGAWTTNDFVPGDELKITFSKLDSGDTIAVIYTPSGDVLQRVKVA